MDPRYRRRRLVGAGAVLALVVVIGGGLAVLLAGGGTAMPHYLPAGGRALSTTAPAARLVVPRGAPFSPAPAAIRAADAQPLATRVAQLFLVSEAGATPTAAAASVAGAPWGGVVLSGTRPTAPMVAAVRAALSSPAGSAPLIAVHPAGHEAALGAARDPAAASGQAAATGGALHALGVTMTLGPVADVDIAGGAFGGRLFSDDPQAVARFAAAALAGYVRSGEIAAVGHFPGQGGASADPDTATAPATVGGSLETLRARDLVPFAAIVAQSPVIQMSNAVFAAFDGVTPASLLAPAIALLRDDLHFQGVVMSGDLDATLNVTGAGAGQAALSALQAGDDLLYVTGSPSEHAAALDGVIAAAQKSATVRELVHQALLRVLTLKARHGLL